ncbi:MULTISPECIES: helix-turn-helix domain-containing protein [unclassified Providencia]|uniref:helix-turn-helix domain-containing protein n=1 Tax=unclassified Providencia TaxID=2633465 RepID=UPI00234B7C04|nr:MULTISPECIES: helix-turn-helix transcriptional regulator [unclassified Providencia]
MNLQEHKDAPSENSANCFSSYCGVVIKRIRKETGITGAQLATKLNISQQQMPRYERGVNKLTVDMLFNISVALNISFESLIKNIIIEINKSNYDDVVTLRKSITASDTIYFY